MFKLSDLLRVKGIDHSNIQLLSYLLTKNHKTFISSVKHKIMYSEDLNSAKAAVTRNLQDPTQTKKDTIKASLQLLNDSYALYPTSSNIVAL